MKLCPVDEHARIVLPGLDEIIPKKLRVILPGLGAKLELSPTARRKEQRCDGAGKERPAADREFPTARTPSVAIILSFRSWQAEQIFYRRSPAKRRHDSGDGCDRGPPFRHPKAR